MFKDFLELDRFKKELGISELAEKATQISDRNLDMYCRQFGFRPEDLRGKLILDVGSGIKESFSRDAAKYGAKVVSMSPQLKHLWSRKRLTGWIFKNRDWQRRSVGARAQSLPFKDDIFYIETASFSVPYYIINKDIKLLALQEMVRVLKPGGRIYMSPTFDSLESIIGEKAIEWLSMRGRLFRGGQDSLVFEKNIMNSNHTANDIS